MHSKDIWSDRLAVKYLHKEKISKSRKLFRDAPSNGYGYAYALFLPLPAVHTTTYVLLIHAKHGNINRVQISKTEGY